jgi:hypothetical protein
MEARIARLMRADRITAIAEKDLKLVTPEPESLVVFTETESFAKVRGGKE